MADKAGATGRRPSAAPTATNAVACRIRQRAHSCAWAKGRPRRQRRSPEPASRAASDKDAPGRLSADYGLWVGSFTRGELPSMRAHSANFLNDVEAQTRLARGRRRPSGRRSDLLVRRRISRGPGSFGTGAHLVPTRPRRRYGVPFRTGPRRLRDGVPCACIVASARGRSRDVVHVAGAGAHGVPLHPWQHSRPRAHVRGAICIDARWPHEGEPQIP